MFTACGANLKEKNKKNTDYEGSRSALSRRRLLGDSDVSVCNVTNERRFTGTVEVRLRFGRKSS